MSYVRTRIRILLCLVIAVAAGFWMWRYYRGWEQNLVRFYITGAIYEIIWCLFFFFFWPRKAYIVRIPLIVFVSTCILEFLQLWKAEFLERIRATLIGAAIIGTDFVWLQFPFYVLGSAVSVFLLAILANKE